MDGKVTLTLPQQLSVEEGRPGREKQKAKRTLGPAWFLKGLLSPLSKGTRRDLILSRVALVDSLEDTLWGGTSQPHL